MAGRRSWRSATSRSRSRGRARSVSRSRRSASIRAEIMFRNGAYVANPTFPSRIGIEASGAIDAVGPGVSGFSIGDRAGAVPFMSWDEWGNWTSDWSSSTASTARARWCRHSASPASRQHIGVEAGAIWCQYGTAWGGLVDHAGVSSGRHRGGHGGQQQRRARRVADREERRRCGHRATRRSDKADFLRSAGADHVIATEEEDFVSRVMEITGGQGFTVA